MDKVLDKDKVVSSLKNIYSNKDKNNSGEEKPKELKLLYNALDNNPQYESEIALRAAINNGTNL